MVRSFLAVAVSIGVLAPASSGFGQEPPWFGLWRLNLEKSVHQPGPAPCARATLKVEPLNDRLRFSYDYVYRRGGVQHLEWDGRVDGRDYIVQGADEFMTYAYTQTSDRDPLAIVASRLNVVVAIKAGQVVVDKR